MKQGGKASGIWFVLFWVFFVTTIISVAALLWQCIGTQTANVHFKQLQSEANASVQEDAVNLVYDAQMTETEQLAQAENIAEADSTVQAGYITKAESVAQAGSAGQTENVGQAEANKLPAATDVRTEQQSREMAAEEVRKPGVSLAGAKQEAKQETAAVQTPDKTLDWEALRSQNPDTNGTAAQAGAERNFQGRESGGKSVTGCAIFPVRTSAGSSWRTTGRFRGAGSRRDLCLTMLTAIGTRCCFRTAARSAGYRF